MATISTECKGVLQERNISVEHLVLVCSRFPFYFLDIRVTKERLLPLSGWTVRSMETSMDYWKDELHLERIAHIFPTFSNTPDTQSGSTSSIFGCSVHVGKKWQMGLMIWESDLPTSFISFLFHILLFIFSMLNVWKLYCSKAFTALSFFSSCCLILFLYFFSPMLTFWQKN